MSELTDLERRFYNLIVETAQIKRTLNNDSSWTERQECLRRGRELFCQDESVADQINGAIYLADAEKISMNSNHQELEERLRENRVQAEDIASQIGKYRALRIMDEVRYIFGL